MADDATKGGLSTLPTEIILYIFTFIPAKQLTRCRQVCQRWKYVIDGLTRSDALWLKHCKKDYATVYKVARRQAHVGVLWYNIYRSLTLWSRLSYAREVHNEFAPATRIMDEIKNFRILRDGIVAVHTRSAIVYYDIETLEISKRGPITGEYLAYSENDETIAILNFHLKLFIMKKVLHNPRHEVNVTFDNVKMFILLDDEVYYINFDDEVYSCKLNCDKFVSTYILKMDDSVMNIGYTDKLHLLTCQRNIYTVVDQELIFTCSLDLNVNLLHRLIQYHFLENLDWRVYFQWMYVLNHYVPEGPLRDIVSMRSYGDIVFVGTHWGVLQIYYAPYSAGELNLTDMEPVKQYNFMERSDCPVLSMCPIMQIDVLENVDGHTVLVAMPKKIAVIEFVHNFKRSASVAMLPYKEIQRVKVLKIE